MREVFDLSGKIKKVLFIFTLLILAVSLYGCGKKAAEETQPEEVLEPEPTPAPAPTPVPTPVPTPTPEPKPENVSILTGLELTAEEASKRPISVSINNLKVASPQSGIGDAGVLCEFITEAGITRFLAIFDKIDEESGASKRLGSVRSARHYVAAFTTFFDSIFIHYGETTYAAKKIDKLKVDDIDGITGIGDQVFYRDSSIKAPHNAFADKEGIDKGIEAMKFRTEIKKKFEAPYDFDFEPSETKVGDKLHIELPYSSYITTYFDYANETGEYLKGHFGTEHVDYNTGKQLSFKNIIVLDVKYTQKDKNGYMDINFAETEGKGYYFCDGNVSEIKWFADENKGRLELTDDTGRKLLLKPGKVYIGIYPDSKDDKIVMASQKEE